MIFPQVWGYRFLDSPRLEQDFGVRIDKAGMLIDNGKRRDFSYPLEKVAQLQANLLQRIKEEKTFTTEAKEKLDRDASSFLAFVESKKNILTHALSDEELTGLYQQYNERFTELNYLPILFVLFASGPLAQEVLQWMSPEELAILAKPHKLPYLLEYERDMLEHDSTHAARLHQKWHWLPFDYYGAEEWDQTHFQQQLTQPNPGRLELLRNYPQRTQTQQEEILRQHNLTAEQQQLIKALQDLSQIQDERKRITTISYPFLQKKLINEVSRRTGIPNSQLWLMTPAEIAAALNGKKTNLAHRQQACAIEIHHGTFVIHEQIPDFLKSTQDKQQDTLTGIPASRGIVKGRVRICKTSQDIKNMQAGEILVAPATTPDYILGFKKASAIVTDEGGITSHAAVISREIGLPCIIGTRNASEILRDGDLIEVDANRGMIRKV